MHRSRLVRTRRLCGRSVTAVTEVQPSCLASLSMAMASPEVVTGLTSYTMFRSRFLAWSCHCNGHGQFYLRGQRLLEATKFFDNPSSINCAPSWWRPSDAPAITRTASLSLGISCGGNKNQAGKLRITNIGATCAKFWRRRLAALRRSLGPRLECIVFILFPLASLDALSPFVPGSISYIPLSIL